METSAAARGRTQKSTSFKKEAGVIVRKTGKVSHRKEA
jgi:hypothetical protein